MKRIILLTLSLLLFAVVHSRETYNFNSNWVINNSKTVTLPHAWNEDDAFAVPIAEMRTGEVWYRKHFTLPRSARGKKVIIEFEGAKQLAEVFLNGHEVDKSENGIMAFGFDLTPYIKEGDNLIEVRTDNDWHYHEQATGSTFQWNDRNFYANYGGLNKNVKLHIMPLIHQTLPLYSNLGTTGQYIYATNFDINHHKATVNVETEVFNACDKTAELAYTVIVSEYNGKEIAHINGGTQTVKAGAKAVLKTSKRLHGLHFWSWGYGYLYKVKTIITAKNLNIKDTVETVTGFRKTDFTEGFLRLNGRGIMMHGYAQRSTNEWAGVGVDVPAWLSDYSNKMLVESGGNLVRWMHVTPSKQDVESCDRVGLIQAMPAGDSEKDVEGRRWQQRLEVMRDAIIYNRNNPSVVFIECGNKGISRDHMLQMKQIRDLYDPYGGRAIGSREMLDIQESEYGGEMLYVNKSDKRPMWMMEYCRDESMRRYWNAWTYPYHAEGAGPRYRNTAATAYNHNQDEFCAELVRRWYDYWHERPGQGTMVNAGGTKIVFSDTQTHGRSEANYRLSGVVDPMRVKKDAFFAQQVMWDGWVDDLKPHTYIVGHWTYTDEVKRLSGGVKQFVVPTIYVVSSGDSVCLYVNGEPLKICGERSNHFLYTFRNVPYSAGSIKAVSFDKNGKELSSDEKFTAGKAVGIRLTPITNPNGWRADGSDVALIDVEAVDKEGRRCPTDFSTIQFHVEGNAEWRGGIAYGENNHALDSILPVECGINRILLRSTTHSGSVKLTASSKRLGSASIELKTKPFSCAGGLSTCMADEGVKPSLDRGETPAKPSFHQGALDVKVAKVEAGSNTESSRFTIDKNEISSWKSSGKDGENWICYHLSEPTIVNEISLKPYSFRNTSYPIEIYADDSLVFRGYTPITLGYSRITLKPMKAAKITIKSIGKTISGSEFTQISELDPRNNEHSARKGSSALQIIELQLIHQL